MTYTAIAHAIGFFAAVATAFQHPAHVKYLWAHRDDPEVLRGLSLVSILVTTANSLLWVVYGLSYNAWPTALASVGAIAVMVFTVWLLHRARVWSTAGLVVYSVFAVACVVWPMFVPQDVLGLMGGSISIFMWLPAAAKVVRLSGSPGALAYPPVMSWVIIANNIAWIIYGVMLDDIWLWLPCPVAIACAVLMLWSYHFTASKIGARTSGADDGDADADVDPVIAKL